MTYKRHIDFYLPVLKTLEDLKEHEVNTLIEETSRFCNLSEEERQERTRKGSQYKYESNIQWAITDLCQGGFIERTSRGVYKIVFDGLLMLEDNPERPNRDYLEARSQKFKDFRYRKGTRNKSDNSSEENLFSNLSEDDIEKDETREAPIEKVSDAEICLNANDLIEKYTNLKKAKSALNMNTEEEDEIIKMLRENLVKKILMKDIERFSEKLYYKHNSGFALVFDCLNSSNGTVYMITDAEKVRKLTDSYTLIYEQPGILDGPGSIVKIPVQKIQRKEKSASRKIKVKFEDGTIVDDRYAADVFVKSIEKIGASKVQKLGIFVAGFPLVGNKAPDKYQYKVIEGKYYVPTNSSTETKKRLLEEIAKAYDIKISVEMY